jgi:hypothetical protein
MPPRGVFKKVPKEKPSEYLTEMNDGGKNTYGDLLLHTNSYTLEEVELLVSVLNQKLN